MAEAVIFDIDGTIVDSVDLHASAWVEASAKLWLPERTAKSKSWRRANSTARRTSSVPAHRTISKG